MCRRHEHVYRLHDNMLLQSISLISIFVFLSSLQFWQVKGQCIDQPGVIQNGMTCSQLLPLGCYYATVLSKCCQSCTAIHTGVTGCEYGDKVANCIIVLCTFYTDPSECCNTCKSATTASTPSQSTTTTTTKTATPQPTIATTTTTPQTTLATTTTPKPTIVTTKATAKMTTTSAMSTTSSLQGQCIDQPGVIQNGMTCLQLLLLGCFDATVLSKCCQSCTAIHTGVTGCEYGDKVAKCITVLCPFYKVPSGECCNTCKPATTASPSTITRRKTSTPQPTLASTPTTSTPQTTIMTVRATTTKPTIITTTATTKMTTTTSVMSTTSSQNPFVVPLRTYFVMYTILFIIFVAFCYQI